MGAQADRPSPHIIVLKCLALLAPIKIPFMHRLLALFAVLMISMTCAPASAKKTKPESAAGDKPPNVILIIIDTLRADHLGAYGYTTHPTSPKLDAWAKTAALFERTYSPSSWTRSALASIFSGLHVHQHEVYSERSGSRLFRRHFTLTEFFANLGYDVGMFFTNPHFKFGMTQGVRFPYYKWNGDAQLIYGKATAWLNRHKSRSFFLVVHNLDPHDKYEYRPEIAFSPKDAPIREARQLYPMSERTGRGGKGIGCDRRTHGRPLPPEELAVVEAAYDAEIAYVDEQLGKFLAFIESSGVAEDTVVIVTADHGEEFLDHGGYWHGCTLHDELIRAPLIMKIPGSKAGRFAQPVSTVDVFPTLVSLVDPGALDELGLSGQSLAPLIEGKSWSPKPLFAATGFRKARQHAVIDGDFKLIVDGVSGEKALYNLKTDPGELRNLLALPLGFSLVYADRAAQMEGLLGDLPAAETGPDDTY